MMLAASFMSVPPAASANLASSANPQACCFATALQISTPNAALSSCGSERRRRE
jgi:hypothetical protein